MRRIAAIALPGLLMGCGDPLVDPQYRGTPLASVILKADWSGSGAPDSADLRAALFFSPQAADVVDLERLTEHRASSVAIAALPSAVTMNLFAWPDAALLVHDAAGAALGYGVGRVLVYRDLSGDGRRQPGEPFVGHEPPMALLYAPAALPAGAAPTSGALPAGLSSVYLPQRCGRGVPLPSQPGDCGVPLGAKCVTDGDCGFGGACLKETKMPWRGGYCTVPEPPPRGCRPGAAAYLPVPRYGLIPAGVAGYYLRPCQQDSDCVRAGDLELHNYTCDVGLRGCMPVVARAVPIGSALEIEPLCPNR